MSKSKKAKIKLKPAKVKFKRKPTLKGFVKFLKKTGLIALFVIYLIVGTLGTALWGKTKAHRSLDINNLPARVIDYRAKNNFIGALFTMHVQKLSRSKEVIEQMIPLAPKLEAPFLFELSRRYVYLENTDEAIFWHMLGLYHLRYDYLRCENMKDTEFFDFFVQNETEPLIVSYIQNNPEKIAGIIARTKLWDMENPPQNNPHYFCGLAKVYYSLNGVDFSEDVIPKVIWSTILETLRKQMFEADK